MVVVGRLVPRPVHLSHPAGSQRLKDAVVGDPGVGPERGTHVGLVSTRRPFEGGAVCIMQDPVAAQIEDTLSRCRRAEVRERTKSLCRMFYAGAGGYLGQSSSRAVRTPCSSTTAPHPSFVQEY